ncbi:MAG: 50S ribosomal protein L18 [Candidatus Vogelbacteria bacterium]|nr:50S ribosomal protein L18 [Candidatus Vogelbacteria bacterium]
MQNKTTQKKLQRERRHRRIRSRLAGTRETPRLVVFRSNKFIYAQLIDDDKGVTIAEANSMKASKGKTAGNVLAATKIGIELAEKAKAKKVSKVVFDRGGYIYTGRVKALAEAARKGGLEF